MNLLNQVHLSGRRGILGSPLLLHGPSCNRLELLNNDTCLYILCVHSTHVRAWVVPTAVVFLTCGSPLELSRTQSNISILERTQGVHKDALGVSREGASGSGTQLVHADTLKQAVLLNVFGLLWIRNSGLKVPKFPRCFNSVKCVF